MTKKLFLFFLFVLASMALLYAVEGKRHNYKPQNGYVPDSETAIAIAVAVWNPIYGKNDVAKEKPYITNLVDNVWHVRGSLPQNMLGGVVEAEISKDDGRIIRVSHEK